MDARHLRAFLAVAEYGGFSAAATRLGYAQSSVSDQVRALERELGVPVLLRTHTGTELTEAGTRIRAYAQQIIDIEAQMRRTAAGVRPLLRIGALEALAARWLPEILTALGAGAAGPGTAADVDLVVATREQLAEDLAAGRLDATFLFGTVVPEASVPGAPASGASATGTSGSGVSLGLRAVVGHDSTVLVAAPGHPLAARSLLAVADLEAGAHAGADTAAHAGAHTAAETGETGSAPGAGPDLNPDAVFLVTEPGCMYRMLFDRFAREVPGGLRIGAVAASPAALRRMARDGHGIAVLPQVAVAHELERGELVRLNLLPNPATVGIEARWRTGLGPAERPLHGLLRLARRRQPITVRGGGAGAATAAHSNTADSNAASVSGSGPLARAA